MFFKDHKWQCVYRTVQIITSRACEEYGAMHRFTAIKQQRGAEQGWARNQNHQPKTKPIAAIKTLKSPHGYDEPAGHRGR